MGSRRGDADHLPLGMFAVRDPDDDDRMTYWRVEEDGKHRALRPWPADVRWAPLSPPCPEGLNPAQRREWRDGWYADVYFGWKEEVIRRIAEDPQAAADEFAEASPTADLPAPLKKRPRTRVRPKPVSAKQRQVAAERLMAEALRRAGMTERAIAAELGVPKTTAHRRLTSGQRVADELTRILLEVRISELLGQVMQAARSATAEDLPRLLAQVEQVRRLQVQASGGEAQPGTDQPAMVVARRIGS